MKNKSTIVAKDGYTIVLRDLYLNKLFLTTTISANGQRVLPGTVGYEIKGKKVSTHIADLIDCAFEKHYE